MKYPKINTLWKRNMNNKALIIPGDYSCEEFRCIKYWEVTEKIDGTNIRIYWDAFSRNVWFKGRTDNAKIEEQGNLLQYLQNTFTIDKLYKIFGEKSVILYGEGLGPKIGPWKTEKEDFVLFDILESNNIWYSREAVSNIADELGIMRTRVLGVMTEHELIKYVKSKPKSLYMYERYRKNIQSEGIVARPCPNMLFKKGNLILMKLKCSDYDKLKKQNE